MKTSTLAWIIIAASLVLIGGIMFTVALARVNFNFSALCTQKLVTSKHNITAPFQNIQIHTDTADVRLLMSEDESCRVICHEEQKTIHTVLVEEDTLKIIINDQRNWYDYIHLFSFSTPNITVYLPQKQYGALTVGATTGDITLPSEFTFESIAVEATTSDVECFSSALGGIKISLTTGDIEIEGVKADNMNLVVSTGEISVESVDCTGNLYLAVTTGDAEIEHIRCKNLTSNGSTGDLELEDVIASENFSLRRSTGDIYLRNCDATDLSIKTSTGSVKGSLLSQKIFLANTDTGSVNVPKTTSGGRCEIETDTGNIKIEIAKT